MKKHYEFVRTGTHTVGGSGKLAGKEFSCSWFACKKEGCSRGAANPIKQVGTATGQLFGHLEACQPALCQQLRARSPHSKTTIDENGEFMEGYSFDELLPHHVEYVKKLFRGLDHIYETRADNGLLEYIRSWDKRAALPAAETVMQLLEVRPWRPDLSSSSLAPP